MVPVFLAALTLTATPYAIARVGTYHSGEWKEDVNGKWLGLFKGKLRSVRLTTRVVKDPLVDKDEHHPSGVEVTAVDAEQPVFLFRGLRPRKVLAAHSTPVSLADQKSLRVAHGDRVFTVRAEKTGERGAQLVLELVGVRQILYTQKEGDLDSWSVQWVGDLDGDSKADWILTADQHYSSETTRLFLSSAAKEGELVRQVAVGHRSGC